MTPHIVLLGAGHAHLEALRLWVRGRQPGARVTLIGREARSLYTGLLPSLIRRECSEHDASIGLRSVAQACGAHLIVAEAVGLDLARRAVLFADRPPIGFDLLSIDVGGAPRAAGGGIGVKPIGRFIERLAAIEAGLRPDDRVAIVGAGPGGTELAVAMAIRLGGRVTLVCDAAGPLPAAPALARRAASTALRDVGAELLCGVSAGASLDGRLSLSDGRAIPAAAVLWATEAAAPAWLAASGLACEADGSVSVAATLQSLSHPCVFAAGDCAAIQGARRPKAGVWAVRAAGPLAANLRRAAAGTPLRAWHPQRGALVIVGLGYGRAVAWRGQLALAGRLMWRWKSWLDRRWMARFTTLAADAPARENRVPDGDQP